MICIQNKPTAYIAETGWPTASMTPENATYEGAVAGVSELQTFLNTYPCQANQNGSYYFYFEPVSPRWNILAGAGFADSMFLSGVWLCLAIFQFDEPVHDCPPPAPICLHVFDNDHCLI